MASKFKKTIVITSMAMVALWTSGSLEARGGRAGGGFHEGGGFHGDMQNHNFNNFDRGGMEHNNWNHNDLNRNEWNHNDWNRNNLNQDARAFENGYNAGNWGGGGATYVDPEVSLPELEEYSNPNSSWNQNMQYNQGQ